MTTPKKIGAYAWNAEIARAIGNIEKATQEIDQLLTNPNTTNPHRKLAIALAKLAAAQAALREMETIVREDAKTKKLRQPKS